MHPMEIHSYKPEYAAAFDRLNRAWIEKYYSIEPFDNEVLTKPEHYILKDGGELWFAVENGEVLGACALLKLRDDLYEFTKLGVDENHRGRGVARALLRHCVQRARDAGHPSLRIYTGSALVPANMLYRSEGFIQQEMSEADRARYKRADVMYELPL